MFERVPTGDAILLKASFKILVFVIWICNAVTKIGSVG